MNSLISLAQASLAAEHIRKAATNVIDHPRIEPPAVSEERKAASLAELPYDIVALQKQAGDAIHEKSETVLYLAYGSNLCAATFQGVRGIRPLAQVNVQVPDLVMTFDLPGIPYTEPCFAGTRYSTPTAGYMEKFYSGAEPVDTQYHKTRWKKGLVGVVYEVTKADYAHIIATEGGGSGYQDIVVSCYTLPDKDIVDEHPQGPTFKAHTLFSSTSDPDHPEQKALRGGLRFARPDPNYAQASSRYLKLITDGADEHALPKEYKEYLHDIRPYTITTKRQQYGEWTTQGIFRPIIQVFFAMSQAFSGKDGKIPYWLALFGGALFSAIWLSYDSVFKKLFGDGERTMNDKDEEVLLRGSFSRTTVYGGCHVGETTSKSRNEDEPTKSAQATLSSETRILRSAPVAAPRYQRPDLNCQ